MTLTEAGSGPAKPLLRVLAHPLRVEVEEALETR